MPTATHAFGTSLAWNGSIVAGLTAINGVELTRESIDVTSHQSAGKAREFIPGLISGSEVSIEGAFDYTDSPGQLAMSGDFDSGVTRAVVVAFPAVTGSQWTLNGFLAGFKVGDATIDGKITFSAKIQPTGKPAFTTTTSAGLTTPFFVISNSAVVTPAAAGAVYDYVATVLTGVASVTITPTAAAGTIVVAVPATGVSQTVASGVPSSAIALGAAGSVTVVTIAVTETNKAQRVYTIRIDRP